MSHENSLDPLTEFGQAIGLLVRRFRAASATQDFSLTQTSVISRLAKHGPATIADLARAEEVKPQSMGAIIAALEKRGIVERQRHPTDGRQVHIHLTAEGASLHKTARDARWSWLAKAFSQLDEKDREALLRAGTIIQRLAKL